MGLRSAKGFRQLGLHFASLSRVALLGAVVVLGASHATAGNLFNVAKVRVDITAKDAVIARDEGMAKAETLAMGRLLDRLVPPGSRSSLPSFPHREIEGLVAGIAIRSEKMSPTQYIGELDVRFDPNAVRQFLVSRSIPFAEEQASAISVLPVVLEGDAVAEDASAAWRAAWGRLDLDNGVAPAQLVVPQDSLDAATIRAVLAGSADAYAILRSVYGYGGLVVAAGEAKDGFFRVQLAGEDAAGRVDAVVTSAIEPGTTGSTEDAAAMALGTLERRWRARFDPGDDEVAEGMLRRRSLYPDGGLPPEKEPLGRVGAAIEFFSVRDWQQIRFGLQRVEELRDFQIVSRSARGAEVVFDFDGTADQLQALLAQNGIALYEREGTLVMRAQ